MCFDECWSCILESESLSFKVRSTLWRNPTKSGIISVFRDYFITRAFLAPGSDPFVYSARFSLILTPILIRSVYFPIALELVVPLMGLPITRFVNLFTEIMAFWLFLSEWDEDPNETAPLCWMCSNDSSDLLSAFYFGAVLKRREPFYRLAF